MSYRRDSFDKVAIRFKDRNEYSRRDWLFFRFKGLLIWLSVIDETDLWLASLACAFMSFRERIDTLRFLYVFPAILKVYFNLISDDGVDKLIEFIPIDLDG